MKKVIESTAPFDGVKSTVYHLDTETNKNTAFFVSSGVYFNDMVHFHQAGVIKGICLSLSCALITSAAVIIYKKYCKK